MRRDRSEATLPTPFIETKQRWPWVNWHDSRDARGTAARFRTPHNDWDDGSTSECRFDPGLEGLRQIVRDAEAEQHRVRALGSSWSLSKVAFVEDCLVNTAELSWWAVGVEHELVNGAYTGNPERLVFAQCGVQIVELNDGLQRRGLALPTAGASNGQTIVGAMSTGTHGSAHEVGAIQDYILALHVVGEGGAHFLIQRRSRPVVTQGFADWLGATLHSDDELFLAAVVGFGSFGLIHAVLFEAVPLFLLGRLVKQFDYDEIAEAAGTHDVSRLALGAVGDPLFHVEFVINPYRRGRGQGGAFARVLYKREHRRGDPLPVLPIAGGEKLLSQDLVSLAGKFTDEAPGVIGGFLQKQLAESAVVPTAPAIIYGTPGQQFGDSLPTRDVADRLWLVSCFC